MVSYCITLERERAGLGLACLVQSSCNGAITLSPRSFFTLKRTLNFNVLRAPCNFFRSVSDSSIIINGTAAAAQFDGRRTVACVASFGAR